MKIALFPGTFNPFTIGHKSVVDRAVPLFDRIIIAIGVNAEKAEAEADEIAHRIRAIARVYEEEPSVEVYSYEGLTADFAAEMGARYLLRGVRSVQDFEYERTLADVNRRISGLETVLMYSLPEHECVSSSMVRELQMYGVDVSEFLP
ncbi:MAG: pantetheine-phosphate adenylyltransferase [Prevotella sp.]|nr:pantetheine-phosphate adenylyltransferase [Prevotella sp.]MCM1075434.1 pantetheine-phosphate adenylyltransferase [Ruminococcus sp.]